MSIEFSKLNAHLVSLVGAFVLGAVMLSAAVPVLPIA